MNQKTFNQISQSTVYREDTVSVSITVCGGSYGGGSEVLVIDDIPEVTSEDILHRKWTVASAITEPESRFAQLHGCSADVINKRGRDGF